DVGKTENAVGASTKAKKMSPPIQQTSDSSMRNRRKDIAENYTSRPLQLAVRILCCLSCSERWARDAGGAVRTLNLLNQNIAQNDAAAPNMQRLTGNLTIEPSPVTSVDDRCRRAFPLRTEN